MLKIVLWAQAGDHAAVAAADERQIWISVGSTSSQIFGILFYYFICFDFNVF